MRSPLCSLALLLVMVPNAQAITVRNDDQQWAHFFATFPITLLQPLLPCAEIGNLANMRFDCIPPVITEPSVLVAEFNTGIQAQAKGEEQLRMQPNPVNDHITITSSTAIGTVVILAADGREVMSRSLRGSNTTIDVSRLPAGSYFLFAAMNDGSFVRKRLIKH